MVKNGCDLVEVGIPYSDPVMDGPTIQAAADLALRNGFRLRQVFDVVQAVTDAGGKAVVMSYYNPIHHYGATSFARDLSNAGGLGVITPDLVPDQDAGWSQAAIDAGIDRIFLVSPSSTDERIDLTARNTSGFLYATAVMGVTGARSAVGPRAAELVARIRKHTTLPIGVGLGVRSGTQAAEIAAFADAVIVGSAFVTASQDGEHALASLTQDLAQGVRK
jgi:tryptophan synthase alpha chain